MPPAPVPGPRTSDAPWVGALPWRGVSLAAICCTGGVTIRGFGATTGVASLLMFVGADPPSFSLGFGCCLLRRGRRRRRRRVWREVEDAQRALRVAEVDLAGQMKEGEQQRGVDRDHGRDGAAFVPLC